MPKSPCDGGKRRTFNPPKGLIFPTTAKKAINVNAIRGGALQFIGNKFQCFVRTHQGAGGEGQGAQIFGKNGGKAHAALSWIAKPTEFEKV